MGKQIIDKLGIILPGMLEVFGFYSDFMELVDKDKFEFLIDDVLAFRLFDKIEAVKQRVIEKNFKFRLLSDLIKENQKYKYLISHTDWKDDSNKPISPLLDIAEYNIRFVFSLGYDHYHFGDWNKIYDMFISFGPYQTKKLKEKFNDALVVEVGNPKFDSFFRKKPDYFSLIKKFKCDSEKRTLVWLPTHNPHCSIFTYINEIAKLTNQFNIILKPHPVTFKEVPNLVEYLNNAKLTHIIDYSVSNLDLFSIADFILSDYAGVGFSALYLDKNLLYLNLDSSLNTLDITSSEMLIRNRIPNINESQKSTIREVLLDDELWEAQIETRKEIRNEYFTPNYGYSSTILASILSNLDIIFKDKYKQNNFQKALSYLTNNKIDEALDILSDEIENNEVDSDYYYAISICLKRLGDEETAKLYLDKANQL